MSHKHGTVSIPIAPDLTDTSNILTSPIPYSVYHVLTHTSKMTTLPSVAPTPTFLLPSPTHIVYTSSHLPPHPKAQYFTSRRQTRARAVSQTSATATCPHCCYPDCTQLRPVFHTSLTHARTPIQPHATAHTCASIESPIS